MTLQVLDIKKEYQTNFEKIKEKLKVFETLTVGFKIAKDNSSNTLYSDPPDSLQPVRRWWNGENRTKTLVHLDDSFKEFMRLLDKIITHASYNGQGPFMKKLTANICAFINSILSGLNRLKFTYPHCAEIHCKIGSIILTLLDFKDDIRRYTSSSKKESRRSNSFEI